MEAIQLLKPVKYYPLGGVEGDFVFVKKIGQIKESKLIYFKLEKCDQCVVLNFNLIYSKIRGKPQINKYQEYEKKIESE